MILTILAENFNKNIMRLAKNESRFVGTTFEALAELSPKRSEAGSVRLADNETQASEAKWDLHPKLP